MKCKQCNIEFESKRSTAGYCSAECRKLAFHKDGKVSVPQVSVPNYDVVENQTVYGRQAVKYDLAEAWDLRPEPLSKEDTPKLLNRGKYVRPDGSEYQFDAIGQVFECTDGEVYPTMALLKAAQKPVEPDDSPAIKTRLKPLLEHTEPGAYDVDKFTKTRFGGQLRDDEALMHAEAVASGRTQEKGSNDA